MNTTKNLVVCLLILMTTSLSTAMQKKQFASFIVYSHLYKRHYSIDPTYTLFFGTFPKFNKRPDFISSQSNCPVIKHVAKFLDKQQDLLEGKQSHVLDNKELSCYIKAARDHVIDLCKSSVNKNGNVELDYWDTYMRDNFTSADIKKVSCGRMLALIELPKICYRNSVIERIKKGFYEPKDIPVGHDLEQRIGSHEKIDWLTQEVIGTLRALSYAYIFSKKDDSLVEKHHERVMNIIVDHDELVHYLNRNNERPEFCIADDQEAQGFIKKITDKEKRMLDYISSLPAVTIMQ